MPRYAAETTVSSEKSKAEIEETLKRYGAIEFQSGWKNDSAMIAFRLKNRNDKDPYEIGVRFVLPFPDRNEKRFTHKLNRRTNRSSPMTEVQRERAYDQEIRQRWRALLLVVKAKLEAVECRISTLEKEFLAFIVVGDGTQTLGEWIVDQGRLQALTDPSRLLPAPIKEEDDGQ